MSHLTEEERQGIADGTLEASRRGAGASHLRDCAECRADVDALRSLLAAARGARSLTDAEPEPFAPIRARIDRDKVVPMPGAIAVRRRLRWEQLGIAAAAVALIATAYLRTRTGADSASTRRDATLELTAVAESTSAYRRQIDDLLMDLQLRRSLLRAETAASVDRELTVIDRAIGELNEALTRDPNNPALRQMLAESYKRKVELLKRVGNAS